MTEPDRPSIVLDELLRSLDLPAPPAWHADAACRGLGPRHFFPSRTSQGHESFKRARAVCETCPVSEPCLDAGLSERFGVWGGTSERERRQIRRRRRDDAA